MLSHEVYEQGRYFEVATVGIARRRPRSPRCPFIRQVNFSTGTVFATCVHLCWRSATGRVGIFSVETRRHCLSITGMGPSPRSLEQQYNGNRLTWTTTPMVTDERGCGQTLRLRAHQRSVELPGSSVSGYSGNSYCCLRPVVGRKHARSRRL